MDEFSFLNEDEIEETEKTELSDKDMESLKKTAEKIDKNDEIEDPEEKESGECSDCDDDDTSDIDSLGEEETNTDDSVVGEDIEDEEFNFEECKNDDDDKEDDKKDKKEDKKDKDDDEDDEDEDEDDDLEDFDEEDFEADDSDNEECGGKKNEDSLNEDVDYRKNTRKIVIKTKEQKFNALLLETIFKLAKSNNDSAYIQYSKHMALAKNFREKLKTKYASKAKAIARKIVTSTKK